MRITNYELRIRNIAARRLSYAMVLFLLAACSGDSARVGGQLIGAAQQPVYLEQVVPGQTAVVDTVTTSAEGKFLFKVQLPDGQPTIYNLRSGEAMIPLLVSAGEKVDVMSYGDAAAGYRVSGSEQSEKVWELHRILTRGAASLDSLSTLFVTASDEAREGLRREYAEVYYKTKRAQIGFIAGNSSSLAAVYALYQRLPGDEVLFNGENDHVYFRMVADSVSRRWPDSRYVAALQREVAEMDSRQDLAQRIGSAEVSELNFPEVTLPNMYGQQIALSSVAAGRVTVVDFWSAAVPACAVNNAELREIWDEFSERGLAVYQVSVDVSKPLWVNAVQEQKLPWTTVCDFRGTESAAPRLWNVGSVPANFVLDAEGNIVAKNVYGERLYETVSRLVEKN